MQLTSIASLFALAAMCTNVVSATPMPMPIDSESDIEARSKSGIAVGALKFIDEIISNIEKDKAKRAEFTKNTMIEMNHRAPQFNYVICHTKHETRFDGERGKDWGHIHREVDIAVGGTIGYEIYSFRSGEFWRKGDGGWINWSYIGNVVSKTEDKSHLVFGTRT